MTSKPAQNNRGMGVGPMLAYASTTGKMPVSPRRAMLFWTSIIVGLLSLQIGLSAWGVYCANRGKGVEVQEDYYNKAINWDADHKGTGK